MVGILITARELHYNYSNGYCSGIKIIVVLSVDNARVYDDNEDENAENENGIMETLPRSSNYSLFVTHHTRLLGSL